MWELGRRLPLLTQSSGEREGCTRNRDVGAVTTKAVGDILSSETTLVDSECQGSRVRVFLRGKP